MTRFSIEWPIQVESGSRPVSALIGHAHGAGWTMRFFPMGCPDSRDMCVEILRNCCENEIFVKGHIYIFQGINYAETKSACKTFIEQTLHIGQKNVFICFTRCQKILSKIDIIGSLTISSNEEDLEVNWTHWETERKPAKQFLYQPKWSQDDIGLTYSFSNFYERSNSRLQAYNCDKSHDEKAHPGKSNSKVSRSQSQPVPFPAPIVTNNKKPRESSLGNDTSTPTSSRASCSSPTPQSCSKENKSGSATPSTNNQSSSTGQKMSMEQKSLAGLACDFLQLRKTGQFSDATLRCGTKEFKVHKAIVSFRSPVLANRFVNETGTLVITDLEPEMLDMLLDYIYSGKLPELTVASVKRLLPAARKYQLGVLKDICMEHFESSMSIQNVLDSLAKAEGNDAEMKMLSVSFICRNFNILYKTELWKLLKKSNSDLCMEIQEHVIEFLQAQQDV